VIARIASLGRRRLPLLARACFSIAAVRVALRIVPLARLLDWVGTPGTARPRRVDVNQLAWAVRTASRILPRTSCLAHALALGRLLCLEGYRASIRIGVRNQPSFSAHAWIEYDGSPLLESDGHVASYASLIRWDLPQRHLPV
jgi:hypothetical protein